MDGDFSVVTVLRYDPALTQVTGSAFEHAGWNHGHSSPFYLLDFHRDRMLKAATYFQWQPAIDVLSADGVLKALDQSSRSFIGAFESNPIRLKILVNRHGKISFEKGPIPSLSLVNLFPKRLPAPQTAVAEGDAPRHPENVLVVDHEGTQRSEHTHYKTSLRPMYDAARQRVGIAPGEPKEVLILDTTAKMVTEASLTTPYFWREGRWVTPPISASFSKTEGAGGIDGVSRRWALER